MLMAEKKGGGEWKLEKQPTNAIPNVLLEMEVFTQKNHIDNIPLELLS